LLPSRCGWLCLAGVTNFSREPWTAWPLFDDWHADKIHWKQILWDFEVQIGRWKGESQG
jgi:hypothetical protein